MRCVSCDSLLNDYESTRKNLNNQFVELCNDCLADAGMDDILLLDRPDLKHHSDDRTTFEDQGIVDLTQDNFNALEDNYDDFCEDDR